MPARWLLPLVALALPAAAAAQTTPPEQTPQALFTDLVVKDPRTTADVRVLLSTGAGFVAAQPQFADLTGDEKMDAVVQVRVPGAAGTVAVYAFSADGTSDGRLRAIFRTQKLYRATVAVGGGSIVVTVPEYAEGDDVCCPAERSERAYGWDARRHRMTRRS
jgi:hypothetical protein